MGDDNLKESRTRIIIHEYNNIAQVVIKTL